MVPMRSIELGSAMSIDCASENWCARKRAPVKCPIPGGGIRLCIRFDLRGRGRTKQPRQNEFSRFRHLISVFRSGMKIFLSARALSVYVRADECTWRRFNLCSLSAGNVVLSTGWLGIDS